LRVRLNGYVDMSEYRSTGQCVLREEWHGYQRPWGTPPRYVVTVALASDEGTECHEAVALETHLIRTLRPRENVAGRVVDDESE
jgi:hypothetical protein